MNDCALIRRYLRNSDVIELEHPTRDFRFAVKMLASLVPSNATVGRVELKAGDERLSDYRSMDAIFGQMEMRELQLSCYEHRFVELVKTIDFFRKSTVQKLRRLHLTFVCFLPFNQLHFEPCKLAQRTEEEKPGAHVRSKNPLWVAGVYLLRSCKYYRVDCDWFGCHLQLTEQKIAQICEVRCINND